MKEIYQEVKEKDTFLTISLDDESIEILLVTVQKELDVINDKIIKFKKDKLRLESIYENISGQRIDSVNKSEKGDESQGYIFKEISFNHNNFPVVKIGKNNIYRKDGQLLPPKGAACISECNVRDD